MQTSLFKIISKQINKSLGANDDKSQLEIVLFHTSCNSLIG